MIDVPTWFLDDNPEFVGPISLKLFSDPVRTPGGQVYERRYILKWLQDHDTDPQTREKLKKSQLLPDHALKELIHTSVLSLASEGRGSAAVAERKKARGQAVQLIDLSQPSSSSPSAVTTTRTTAAPSIALNARQAAKNESHKLRKLQASELKLDGCLGHGSTGIVYRAIFRERQVVVKVLRSSAQPTKQKKALLEYAHILRFYKEYPNIIGCHGVVIDSEPYQLVMHVAHRGSLRKALLKAKWKDQMKLRVILDIAMGLAALHKHSTLHGALSSDSVLLDKYNTAMLSDFDVYRHILAEGRVTCEHIRYSAPELFSSPHVVTSKTDMYAFGILIWEICAGTRAYKNLHVAGLVGNVLAHNRPEIKENVSSTLKQLMTACWHKTVSKRPTAEEAVSILEAEYIRKYEKKTTTVSDTTATATAIVIPAAAAE
jgi:hypothetical protein